MKIALFSGDIDWLHIALAVLLVVALISRFRTSHHKRFIISFTMKREKDDLTSTDERDENEPPSLND
jgi:hypothetical protein